MKGFIFTLAILLILGSTNTDVYAQSGKISAGISMSLGGFSLDGNPDDNSFTGTRREENRSEAEVVGAGLRLAYGVLDNLDAMYH